MLGRKTVY